MNTPKIKGSKERQTKLSRRKALSQMAAFGLGATGAAGPLASTAALAETAIDRILNSNNRDSWNDQFDARSGNRSRVSSNTPVFAPQTIDYIQQAIAEHQNIVGRWRLACRAGKQKTEDWCLHINGEGVEKTADDLR